MKRAAYDALTPEAREQHDRQNLIGFVYRCQVPLAAAREAIEQRMLFLPPTTRAYILNWCERHL